MTTHRSCSGPLLDSSGLRPLIEAASLWTWAPAALGPLTAAAISCSALHSCHCSHCTCACSGMCLLGEVCMKEALQRAHQGLGMGPAPIILCPHAQPVQAGAQMRLAGLRIRAVLVAAGHQQHPPGLGPLMADGQADVPRHLSQTQGVLKLNEVQYELACLNQGEEVLQGVQPCLAANSWPANHRHIILHENECRGTPSNVPIPQAPESIVHQPLQMGRWARTATWA